MLTHGLLPVLLANAVLHMAVASCVLGIFPAPSYMPSVPFDWRTTPPDLFVDAVPGRTSACSGDRRDPFDPGNL